MSSIANMSVKLGLDAIGFTAGLGKASRDVEKFARNTEGRLSEATRRQFNIGGTKSRFGGVENRLGSVAGAWGRQMGVGALGVAGAFATGAVAAERLVNRKAEEFDNLQDAAESAGVSLTQFMKITGNLDAEDTGRATTALQKMGKALAEMGADDSKKFLSAGLNPATLVGKGTEGALRAVAKAYAETEDPVKKLTIAYTAFGKSAADVIPVLSKIAAQSGELEGKFKGMTDGQIAALLAYKQFKTELGGVKNNAFNRVAGDLAQSAMFMKDLFGGKNPTEEFVKRGEAFRAAENAAEAKGKAALDAERREKAAEARQKRINDLVADAALKSRQIADQLGTHQGMTAGQLAIRDLVKGARGLGIDPAGGDVGRLIDKISADEFNLQQLEKSEKWRKEHAANFGRGPRSTMKDYNRFLGRMIQDKIGGANPFAMTSPSLARGTAEEGSFRAQFEQRREGMKTMESQMIDIFKQMLEEDKKANQKLEKLGQEFSKSMPKIGMAMLR